MQDFSSGYWQVRLAKPIPDFGEGPYEPAFFLSEESHMYIAHVSEIVGYIVVGAKITLSTARAEQLNQHLEGCEARQMHYLHGKQAIVIANVDATYPAYWDAPTQLGL